MRIKLPASFKAKQGHEEAQKDLPGLDTKQEVKTGALIAIPSPHVDDKKNFQQITTPKKISHPLEAHKSRREKAAHFMQQKLKDRIINIKNEAEAFDLFHRAARQGKADSQYKLGLHLRYGKGCIKNEKLAYKWMQKAVENGIPEAQLHLGNMLEYGIGVTKDEAGAVKWYRLATLQGVEGAAAELDRLSKKYVDALNHLAHREIAESKKLSEIRSQFSEIRSPLSELRSQAEKGKLTAQVQLAEYLTLGLGGYRKDEREAVIWFREAAEQGDMWSQYNLAYCLENGNGIQRNLKQAMFWYTKAAEQGYADAQYELGCCLEYVMGFEDETAALGWYMKAEKQGHQTAKCVLTEKILSNYVTHVHTVNPEIKSLSEFVNLSFEDYLNRASIDEEFLETELGNLHFGNIVHRSRGDQFLFYRANELGDPYSQFEYAMELLKDNRNKEAIQWLRKSAERRNAGAQFRLAMCLYAGLPGVTKDEKEAYEWFAKSGKQGLKIAEYLFVEPRFAKQETKQKESKAENKTNTQKIKPAPFVSFCHPMHSSAQVHYDFISHLEKAGVLSKDAVRNYLAEQVEWCRQPAQAGFAEDQYKLATFLANGWGCEKDNTEAVYWYRLAADQGHVEGQYCLAYRLINGIGCDKDEVEAIKYYRKAAEEGLASAQNNLGRCFEDGIGFKVDKKEAVVWYKKAAEQGDPDAQYNLGCSFLEGIGIAENYQLAAQWFAKAAEQGEANAQYAMGRCFEEGIGVIKDEEAALGWYRKAEKQGDQDAKRILAEKAKSANDRFGKVVVQVDKIDSKDDQKGERGASLPSSLDQKVDELVILSEDITGQPSLSEIRRIERHELLMKNVSKRSVDEQFELVQKLLYTKRSIDLESANQLITEIFITWTENSDAIKPFQFEQLADFAFALSCSYQSTDVPLSAVTGIRSSTDTLLGLAQRDGSGRILVGPLAKATENHGIDLRLALAQKLLTTGKSNRLILAAILVAAISQMRIENKVELNLQQCKLLAKIANALGRAYQDVYKSKGTEMALKKACTYWEIAGNLGHVKAQYNAGIAFYKLKEIQSAFEWLSLAKRNNHPKAIQALQQISGPTALTQSPQSAPSSRKINSAMWKKEVSKSASTKSRESQTGKPLDFKGIM